MRAVRQPAQRGENKPLSGRRGRRGTLLAANAGVLRSNLSGGLFRFLLQQRRSVSVSGGLNEGLVSRATGCRSTGLGSVCLLSIRPCVYSRLHPALPPPRPITQTLTFTGVPPPPPSPPDTLSSLCPAHSLSRVTRHKRHAN